MVEPGSCVCLAVLASSCTSAPHPARVRIVTDAPILEMGLGANAWHRVGLTAGFEDDVETPDCGGTLQDGCELAVTVVMVDNLVTGDGRANGTADVDAMLIKIDTRMTGRALAHVIAHELGHVVFRCDHLSIREDGADVGIMSRVPTTPWIIEPTAADYSIACRSAGYCLED